MTKDLHLGDFTSNAAKSSIPKYYGETLLKIAQENESVVALTADLTASTECELFRDAYPKRFFTTGIAEANMVGIASGMARTGDIPFVHTFSVFLTRRCFDQVAMQVAYPKTNVKLCGFLPGLTTLLGVSHQAIDDNAMMRVLPNIVIVEPCGASQIEAATIAAYNHNGPVYLRMHRPIHPLKDNEIKLSLEIGKGQILRKGQEVIIFASGLMVEEALKAAEILESTGVSASVANIHTLKPIETDFIIEHSKDKSVVITAENHSIIGGLGSAVAEILMEAGIKKKFRRVGVQDVFAEGASTDYLFEKYGLSARKISLEVQELLGFKK